MKLKTSELTGRALDWAVAIAEGGHGLWYDTVATWWITIDGRDRALSKGWAGQSFTPSTDWAQGGPIIDREGIGFFQKKAEGYCQAARPGAEFVQRGPTPLIAAMRCYVASKLGDEVEAPEDLA